MVTIVGISGSLRQGSFNAALLRAAAALAPEGTRLEIASIRGVPLYDADLEAADFPAAVTALKDRVAAADGLMLVTPEYNNSIPGVFKNAIDWMTRPPRDIPRVFGGRPVAVLGASPGQWGTTLAQAAWLPVLRTLATRPYFEGRLAVPRAATVFDAEGRLVDAEIEARLRGFVEGFARFAAEARRAKP